MAPQTPNIHGPARAPFGVFQVKAGAECLCAAGQDNGRCIAINPYAAASSIRSINVASSAPAFELLTRFDTGQR